MQKDLLISEGVLSKWQYDDGWGSTKGEDPEENMHLLWRGQQTAGAEDKQTAGTRGKKKLL